MNEANEQVRPVNDQDLAELFHRAARMMGRSHHRRSGFRRHGQNRALSVIMEKGPINQRELLEILDVRSSSLSEMLAKLERKELIVRQRNEEDKRSFIVSATDKAKADFSGRGRGRSSSEGVFTCLEDEERGQLKNILEKMIASLGDEAPGRRSGFGRCGDGRGRRGFSEGSRKGRGRRPRDRGGRDEEAVE
ncbi:MarR family winged helix-turn-helix transcriptional regulator [Desulfatibacillum aliphaticivorans]|uniref:MarR family winged helix-turn-helix transcriptional regulator n=1 Tax=Desulfatibacillum aliphaticivorans TaxID=218208 RepID=UPI0003F69F3C|nr:MarR family transcriptional regulator [Desulfatibacillum aliphaticivorans]